MTAKKWLITLALAFLLAAYPVYATSTYTPHAGDYFNYHEIETLSNGTGSYTGYTETTVVDGKETMNSVDASGTVSASYSYTYTFTNSSGSSEGSMSGDYTYSSTSYYYVNGTDDQTGYVNPTVWFLMDNSIPKGGSFNVLNTVMTVQSTSYGYYLLSESHNVKTIFAQGSSNYERNDVYGHFTATYTWKIYFDPATGYIVGYNYIEQDTNPTGDGFTWTDNLYVTQTSYTLETASGGSGGGGVSVQTVDIGIIAVILAFIIIAAIIIFEYSRRRKKLPKHAPQQEQAYVPPPPASPPPTIDLTPKEQPPVQQIVIKEVVKVKCRYCGALIDSTATTCPVCGAPRN